MSDDPRTTTKLEAELPEWLLASTLELSRITEESQSRYSLSTKKDSRTDGMADISTASSLSCGLERTTTEVFQPLGERQTALKNRIIFMVVDYVGLKDVVVDENIDELISRINTNHT